MADGTRFDILVAGNGLAGKFAALALANAGFSIAIAAPPALHADKRTTALMMPSIKFLGELGVWGMVSAQAAPLQSMRIVDGTNNLVRARTVTFHASEIDEEAFGWNIPNTALNDALDEKILSAKSITRFSSPVSEYETLTDEVNATLSDGTKLSAKLIVGADGRNSLARNAAGVKAISWSYPQTAFVTTFQHRIPHQNVSTEFHTNSGPCVQVPLPGNRSSLVWVVAPERASALVEMNDAALSLAVEQQIFSILGKVAVDPERQTYPLSGQYPDKFAANRIALIGEAAHVFPPIGAQGLNLGLRDVEDLVDAAISNPVDPGSPAVTTQYDRARRPDIMARVGAVHALNRSLLSGMLPAQLARAFGLAVLDSAAPLRGLFMREGMRPGAGFSAIFDSIKKSVGEKRT